MACICERQALAAAVGVGFNFCSGSMAFVLRPIQSINAKTWARECHPRATFSPWA